MEEIKNKSLDDAVKIFNSVYEMNIDRQKLFHKHYANPTRVKEPIKFYFIDNETAGMNAFMGVYVKEGKKTHYLSQSCDTAVLKKYRGQGIFSKIIREQEKNDKETEFIFGLPNEKSLPGFMKMGWIEITKLSRFIRVIKPGAVFLGNESKIGKAIDTIWGFLRFDYHKINLSENETVHIGKRLKEEDIIQINKQIEYGFIRDKEFYDWKLGTTSFSSESIILRKRGDLKGFLLYHIKQYKKGNILIIDDWNAQGNLSERVQTLAKLLQIVKNEASIIDVPFVNIQSEDLVLWNKLHFLNLCALHLCRPNPVVVSPRGEKNSYLKKCSFKNIDTDTILN